MQKKVNFEIYLGSNRKLFYLFLQSKIDWLWIHPTLHPKIESKYTRIKTVDAVY
jgi:hypothetical protein